MRPETGQELREAGGHIRDVAERSVGRGLGDLQPVLDFRLLHLSGVTVTVGGVILASRLRSVATNTGGGNLLLNVIAAAVIGGTSLFGGSGRVVSALYGALVITAIQNGMDLLGLNSGIKFIITGIVLLLAVMVDSVSKRRRVARGLT